MTEKQKMLEEFKTYWYDMYGDVDVEIHDEVFLIFLRKYKGDFVETAAELNEFCKLDENDPEYNEIENRLWI